MFPRVVLRATHDGPGRSVAWLARLLGVQEVVSSNLTAPTIRGSASHDALLSTRLFRAAKLPMKSPALLRRLALICPVNSTYCAGDKSRHASVQVKMVKAANAVPARILTAGRSRVF